MPTSQVGGANAGQRDVQVSAMSFGAGFGDARTHGGIEPPWVRGRLTASVSVHCTETDALLPAHCENAWRDLGGSQARVPCLLAEAMRSIIGQPESLPHAREAVPGVAALRR